MIFLHHIKIYLEKKVKKHKRKSNLSFFINLFYNDYGDSMNEFFKGMVKGLLIIAVIFLLIYTLSYSKWVNEPFDDKVIEYNDGNNDEIIKKEDDVDYKKYYDAVKYQLVQNTYGQEFFNIYYGNEGFNNKYYTYIAIINIINNELLNNCSNYSKEIASVEVLWKIKEIFGDVVYEKVSFESSDGFLSIKYNSDSDTYLVTTNKCPNIDYTKGSISTTVEKTSVENNYLYVYEKALYMVHSTDELGNLVIYYHGGVTEDDTIIATDIENVDYQLIPSYIYMFKKDGNSYIFDGVRKR